MSMPSAEPTDDFIEFPGLNRPAVDWRSPSDAHLSDCIIALEDGTENPNKKYPVHLRALCMSAVALYKHAVRSNLKDLSEKDAKHSGLVLCAGDITIKLQDGSSFSMGVLSKPVRILKEQIQECLGIAVYDQRLFHAKENSRSGSLEEDWRTLTGCGLRAGDTLLLQHQPWQDYDSTSKTLTLHLPEPCIRRARRPRCSRRRSLPRLRPLATALADSRRGRVFERLLDAMYSYSRDLASFEALARDLQHDEALAALWKRLDQLDAGAACDCSLLPLTLRRCRTLRQLLA